MSNCREEHKYYLAPLRSAENWREDSIQVPSQNANFRSLLAPNSKLIPLSVCLSDEFWSENKFGFSSIAQLWTRLLCIFLFLLNPYMSFVAQPMGVTSMPSMPLETMTSMPSQDSHINGGSVFCRRCRFPGCDIKLLGCGCSVHAVRRIEWFTNIISACQLLKIWNEL